MNADLIPTLSRESDKTGMPGHPGSGRQVLTEEDRARSRTPEALQKARETKRERADQRREYARQTFELGYTVKKIADDVGLEDSTVERMVSSCRRFRYGRGVIHPDPGSPLHGDRTAEGGKSPLFRGVR